MGIQTEGIEAEQWLLEQFRIKGFECFQPDAISFENGVYVLNEIKHQEYYKAPPFDGHGLPLWQVKARMKFWLKTNIRCRLIIKEKGSNKIYSQWLDLLEEEDHFDTQGTKPRRIYKLSSFNETL